MSAILARCVGALDQEPQRREEPEDVLVEPQLTSGLFGIAGGIGGPDHEQVRVDAGSRAGEAEGTAPAVADKADGPACHRACARPSPPDDGDSV